MIFMSGIILALFIFYIIVLLARPPKKIIDRRSVGCHGGEGCLPEIGANTEVSVLDPHMEETLSRMSGWRIISNSRIRIWRAICP